MSIRYPRRSGFNIKSYSDSDYAGCNLDRKSTSGCQILRGKLVCSSAKKQTFVAMSSAEAEYVNAARCSFQVLWIKSHLAEYDVLYKKVTIFCYYTIAIAISNNPVLNSRTKHIDIKYHFIIDHAFKADPSFTRLVAKLDCIIKLNNGVALKESNVEGYKQCFTAVALTKQPSTYYSKFLREFQYTAEADMATKSISITLLHLDKPISFELDTFLTDIGLKYSDAYVFVPQKETESNVEGYKQCFTAVALTKQPSTYYSKFLREFQYTAEADMATKSISITLLHLDKPISFELDTFLTDIGLKYSDAYVFVPQKETVKAELAII
nr:hypothetical protein [Tanacetum cinerariifolium]